MCVRVWCRATTKTKANRLLSSYRIQGKERLNPIISLDLSFLDSKSALHIFCKSLHAHEFKVVSQSCSYEPEGLGGQAPSPKKLCRLVNSNQIKIVCPLRIQKAIYRSVS